MTARPWQNKKWLVDSKIERRRVWIWWMYCDGKGSSDCWLYWLIDICAVTGPKQRTMAQHGWAQAPSLWLCPSVTESSIVPLYFYLFCHVSSFFSISPLITVAIMYLGFLQSSHSRDHISGTPWLKVFKFDTNVHLDCQITWFDRKTMMTLSFRW